MIAGVATLHAEQAPQYRLEFTFEGMNPKWLADLSADSRSRMKIDEGVMPFFSSVVRPNGEDSVQLLSEVSVNHANTGDKKVLCGIKIDFATVANENAIVLSGTTLLRRSISKDGAASPAGREFETKESFFKAELKPGESTMVATTGEGEDQTRLVVKTVALDEAGRPID